MDSDKRNSTDFERLLLVVTVLLVFLMAARTPLDSDLWWHLRAGETTWQTGVPMVTDTFSYTRADSAWVNHSWLSQVILYLCFKSAGFLGIAALTSLLASLSMVLVMLQMPARPLLRSFLVVAGSTVAALVWSPRPQLFSLVFTALTGYLLYLYRWRGINRLWVLPVLFVGWSNLHGGYPLGLLLIGCILAGETLDLLSAASEQSPLGWHKLAQLAGWTGLSILAVVVNPNGVSMWMIPFQTVSVNVLQNFIQEWSSPNFHDFTQIPFLLLLVILMVSFGIRKKRACASDLIVSAVATAAALVARRNFGFFVLVILPVLARNLEDAADGWKSPFHPQSSWMRFLKQEGNEIQTDLGRLRLTKYRVLLNLTAVALMGAACAAKLYVVTHPVLVNAFLPASQPVSAVAWIQQNQPEGRLFNAYNWGGYLDWFLRDYPVFMDGRTDLFGDEILGQWLDVVKARPGWQAVLERWKVRLILLEPDRPVTLLLKSEGWRLLYSDPVAVVYGK